MQKSLEKLGVKLVLFDLDNTLIQTHAVFLAYHEWFIKYICEQTQAEESIVRAQLNDLNRETFALYNVHPESKWRHIYTKFVDLYPTLCTPNEMHNFIESHLQDVEARVYKTVIDLQEGAIELLQSLKDAGVEIGLVTHADLEWTLFKLSAVGLDRFFQENNTFTIPSKDKKTHESWTEARIKMGFEASQTLGVGDNLEADVIALREGDMRAIYFNAANNYYHFDSDKLQDPNIAEISHLAGFELALQKLSENNEKELKGFNYAIVKFK